MALLNNLERNNTIWYAIAALLLLFAAFQNLGEMPLLSDDGLRGLTALEMELSGNYLIPTQWGELYYKKPPVFMWLIVLSSKITGDWSNFTIRLPVVISYLLFGLSIYWFLRRIYDDKRLAWLNTFVFWTVGHIIIISIKKGMIDMTFSWMVYVQLMAIFYFYQKKNFWLLFTVSYACAALAFLQKGLPALVFQGFTLLVWFIYNKEFRRLFHLPHIVGGLVFLAIVGGYYAVYSAYNPGKFDEIISTLWEESAMRTAGYFDVGKFVGFVALFPIKYVLYKLLPWSLLIICWWRKDFFKKLWEVPVLRFSVLAFLVNIPIYWLSPGTQTRYILMLFPFFTVLLVHFYWVEKMEQRNQLVERIFLGLLGIMTVAWLVFPFLKDYQNLIDYLWLKCIALTLSFAAITFLYYKLPKQRIMLFAIAIIMVRIGMNFTTLPVFYENMPEHQYDLKATEVGRMTKGEDLYLYKDSFINTFVGLYTVRERMAILGRDYEIENDTYYIIDEEELAQVEAQNIAYEQFYQFETRERDLQLFLVKFENHP